MMALEWNIGMDTYTVSPVLSPNRPASIRPGMAIFPCVHRTAFGSPLVPDVKISMSRSSAAAGAASSGACPGSSSPPSVVRGVPGGLKGSSPRGKLRGVPGGSSPRGKHSTGTSIAGSSAA